MLTLKKRSRMDEPQKKERTSFRLDRVLSDICTLLAAMRRQSTPSLLEQLMLREVKGAGLYPWPPDSPEILKELRKLAVIDPKIVPVLSRLNVNVIRDPDADD